MASTISGARQALYTLLAGAQALAGVQVTFGIPATTAGEEQEVVALLGIEAGEEDWAALGNKRRDEMYQIVVAVKAYDPSGTAATVDARCWQIVDAVRDTVLTQTTMGVDGIQWVHPVGTRSDGVAPAQGGGWVAFATVPVGIKARL